MVRLFGPCCLIVLCLGCVPSGGGDGSGGSGGSPVETDATVCTPDCTDRVCGSDGCDGICGECADGEICTAAGACFEVPATCGDDACTPDDGETCETCPADCGACCGDGLCTEQHGEDCATCPADCGCPDGQACGAGGVCEAACMPDCDGRTCGPDGCGDTCGECGGEDVCGADGTCAPPPDTCGNDTCDAGEDCANCMADYGCGAGQDCVAGQCTDAPRCGDGTCNGNEDCGSCVADCGCDAGEDCVGGVCTDAPRCGDGTCNGNEDCERCPADCGCGAGEDCVNAECVCVPQCNGAECGDDGCGGSCGACPVGAACAGGDCVFDCAEACGELWAGTCTVDGFGLRLCTPDAERPGCTTPSRRIPCGEGRVCDGGACGGRCVKPEVILLVDRSSSMIGERWQFTRETLVGNAADRTDLARLGLRTFPSEGDGCAAGGTSAPVFDANNVFRRMPEPAQVAQTPIAAAFEGVEDVFGDPDEGESVILITDGDETCDDELAAVERVDALRRRGIRTFAVGISRQANGELLAAIARAGGTDGGAGAPYYVVDDAAQLRAALDDIFLRLETCVCNALDTRCDGGVSTVCADDGFSFEPLDDCPFGCYEPDGLCHPVCDPAEGLLVCDGDDATLCNARGDGFDVIDRCPFGCDEGVGCFPACRPGSRRCDGAVSTLCTEDGAGFEPVENCDGFCDAATGLCGEGACAPLLDFRCIGGGLGVCTVDGRGFELQRQCECNPETAMCTNVEAEGELRLDGDVPHQGLLRVYHAGEWGTVCDDSFGLADEQVACRQLGYPDRVQQLDLTGDGTIWMDDVACVGDEARLAECPFRGWGVQNCNHTEDVGLTCLVPDPGSAFCIADDLSWQFLGDGVVRRAPCLEGCDPETGACIGGPGPGPVEGIALPPEQCYAHHGDCASWNGCVDAAGCAALACTTFGHGAPISWLETNACDGEGRTCRPYQNGRFDAQWNSRVDCQLPGVYEVVCEPL